MIATIWILSILLISFLVGGFMLILKLREQKNVIKDINHKYEKVDDIDSYVCEKNKELQVINGEIKAKQQECKKINNEIKKQVATQNTLKKELSAINQDVYLCNIGFSSGVMMYGTTEEYREALTKNKLKQKNILTAHKGILTKEQYKIDGDSSKGRSFKNKQEELMLLAFNGACDSIISKVTWNNLEVCKKKIERLWQNINTKNKDIKMSISCELKDLRIEELQIEYERKELEKKIKEEEKAKREELKQEQKELQKLEEDRERAEREEKLYQKQIQKFKEELTKATGIKYENLVETIEYYKKLLEEAQQNKERALSMAQQTRRGYVYVISNVGSFGEKVFKIGMTRRLIPEERVRELSCASVPFKFDIHAMIECEDAPTLEASLHKYFDNKRVNKLNMRKEYFQVDLHEIKQAVKDLGYTDAQFIDIPEDYGREYYETLQINSTL